MEKEFLRYLQTHFAKTVVYQYLRYVKSVMEREELGWFTLARKIDGVVDEYDVDGLKSAYGDKGHRSCINALKAYRDFLNSTAFVVRPAFAGETGTSADTLEKRLNRTGKAIFVKYYTELSSLDPERCREAMEGEGFTPAAVRTRVSNGISIFKDHQDKEALKSIIDSNKVSDDVKEKAKDLLNEYYLI